VFVEFNLERKINYAINKILNIFINYFVFVEFVVIMIVIVFIFAFAVKNLIIIQMKKCTHCERYYHVKNECRDKYFHLKRDHQSRKNQSNRDDRDNKWRRKNDKNNDNDNDNSNDNDNRDDDDENVEKFHKLYIAMILETLSTMSVMFVQIIFWILNNACSQYSIREKSTFISYTIFNKSISISDLERSIYVMKQKTIRVICKINNKQTNIFFFNVFNVSKCFLNLINFD
jgi:cell division protein FtsL